MADHDGRGAKITPASPKKGGALAKVTSPKSKGALTKATNKGAGDASVDSALSDDDSSDYDTDSDEEKDEEKKEEDDESATTGLSTIVTVRDHEHFVQLSGGTQSQTMEQALSRQRL